MISHPRGRKGVDLGIDGASLIREAHGRKGDGESLNDALRRVIAEKYPDHQEEVMRATRLLMDMMALMGGGNARRAERDVLAGRFQLSMVLNVRDKKAAEGRGAASTYSDLRCTRCGGEYLSEFNFCLSCGSLWRPRTSRWTRNRH
jgi:rRNA maturation endonuclease Nob1